MTNSNILSTNGLIYSSYQKEKDWRVLIGTPIHESKDYCLERWLANVAKLKKVTKADILLVDSSPGLDYLEKVKKYCRKYKLKVEIIHFEIWQYQSWEEKVCRSREIIRQHLLSHDYDAWFSWECDQIIPANTLKILTRIMKAGNYSVVHPGIWSKDVQLTPEVSFSVCLIYKSSLIKNGFLTEYPNMSGSTIENELLFKKRVLADKGSYIEVYGLIKPIYHLNE